MPKPHNWIASTLGHGDLMCADCHITNLEASALGVVGTCTPEGRRPNLTIVPKPTVDEEIKLQAIRILREAIDDVEAGKVSGVIILSKEVAGTWYHRASGSMSIREDVGSIFMLLLDRIMRTRDVVEEGD